MRTFSIEKRSQIIGAVIFGTPIKEIAIHFHTETRTVKAIWEKYRQTGTVKDKPRSGRPKITNARTDRRIVREHKKNPYLTATQSANVWNIGRKTVSRILKNHGLICRRPVKKPFLTPLNRRMRLLFSERTRHWNNQ